MVKVWDYLSEYEHEKQEIHQAIEDVLTSGQLILGQHVEAFEQSFADYTGVKYGVGVNSGTDALFLAMKALNIGEGDEVITVANTAVPTVSAIVSTGATPKFIDVDPDSLLMDVALIEAAITAATKCILPVHLYGQCVDMHAVQAIADKHGIAILEDCAQAHGATFGDRKAGSMSKIAAFSFYPTKILGGFGDAGMVLTDDEAMYNKLKRLRFYGMEKTYDAKEHGFNSRLDELHAAILLKKLPYLDEYIQRRQELALRYDQALNNTALSHVKKLDTGQPAYYVYVCRSESREYWMNSLREKGIHTNISYPWPIHTMDAYRYLGYQEGDLPHTEAAVKEIFSIPLYPSLSDIEQNKVIASIVAIDSEIKNQLLAGREN